MHDEWKGKIHLKYKEDPVILPPQHKMFSAMVSGSTLYIQKEPLIEF